MYRSCIFCSAKLKANDALERFPVGRSIAFDAEKGRLWAVCPRCARWNLAPIEERWEAIEDAERLFRDTRARVQRENIGLAKLRDGTRLVRVGEALTGELAAWRYGGELGRRRRRWMLGAAGTAALVAAASGGLVAGIGGTAALIHVGWGLLQGAIHEPEVYRFPRGSVFPDEELRVDAGDLRLSKLTITAEQVGLAVPVRVLLRMGDGGGSWRQEMVVVAPGETRTLLRRGMVHLNARGAGRRRVAAAVELLSSAGSAESYLCAAAARDARVADPEMARAERHVRTLALEMAVHDELEREALRGELSALHAAWRQAEEIAAIADRLPDELAPSEPPRIDLAR